MHHGTKTRRRIYLTVILIVGKIYLNTCTVEDERCQDCQIISFSCMDISYYDINRQVTLILKILLQYLSTLFQKCMKDDLANKHFQIL